MSFWKPSKPTKPPNEPLCTGRATADFDAGHIAGAYNTTMADMLTAAGTSIPTDKAYAIACYTGQTAS